MKKRESFVIPRSKWTGMYEQTYESACSPNPEGRQCCLGHHMSFRGYEFKTRMGYPHSDISNRNYNDFHERKKLFPEWINPYDGMGTKVAMILAAINDDVNLKQENKETLIIQVFDQLDIDVTFVD